MPMYTCIYMEGRAVECLASYHFGEASCLLVVGGRAWCKPVKALPWHH